MRLFKTKWFCRYAQGERINDSMLWEAIRRAERGIIDANLGGYVIKQRVGKDGQSRKGYRVVIAFKTQKRAIFMFGFAKSDRDNIDEDELKSLKEMASSWLNANEEQIDKSLLNGSLKEIKYD